MKLFDLGMLNASKTIVVNDICANGLKLVYPSFKKIDTKKNKDSCHSLDKINNCIYSSNINNSNLKLDKELESTKYAARKLAFIATQGIVLATAWLTIVFQHKHIQELKSIIEKMKCVKF